MGPSEVARPPGCLERTFLYTFCLAGFILLLHSSRLYLSGGGPQQLVILAAPPRPYYGKPSRPTTPRPKPMSLNIDMEERAAVMRERVGVMRETCRHYGEDILNPKRIFSSNHSLMWDLDHKLVYCPVYKVASGTWTTNFLRLSKFNSDLPRWQRFSKLHGASESASRALFPPPAGGAARQRKLLREMTKFLVVRHPFDRIISAYTGKIANPLAKPRFYRKLQKEIIKKYRRDQTNSAPPSFAEYVHYLLDLTEDLTSPRDWRVVDCVQAYYSVCAPCDVQYDLVIKLETHDEDTEFLIRSNNLTELEEPFTMWKHSSKDQNSIGDYDYYLYDEPYRNPLNLPTEGPGETRETSENTLEAEMVSSEELKRREKEEYKQSLFGQLSRAEIKHLYRNYKIDFEMFDYQIGDFLKYASS